MDRLWLNATTLILAVAVLAILTSCSSGSPTPNPALSRDSTQVVRTASQHLNLTEKSEGQFFIEADIGDRVQVNIEINQMDDAPSPPECAKPTIKDSFGNPLATLALKAGSFNFVHLYEYAFFVAARGRHFAYLDNHECDVRKSQVEADITWTIYRP